MKREISYFIASICLLASCIDKEQFVPSGNGEEELDLSFDFSMKSVKEVSIIVESDDKADKAGIPFYIYLENPYMETGDRRTDLLPIYQGETSQDGTIKTNITVPGTATQIYVYTPYSTYSGIQGCDIQNKMTVIFRSIYMEKAELPRSRTGENRFEGTRTGKCLSPATNTYSYYNFDFNTDYASFGMISNGVSADPEIITAGSSMTLTANEEKWANAYFPEQKTVNDEKYLGPDYCTDLIVQRPSGITGTFKGAHVWVTFIGDGGFSNSNGSIINSLCYYTYTGNLSGSDARSIHKTMIYPSTNVNQLRSYASAIIRSRVQLLYWDGEKYTDVFPEGVKIGWAMISNGDKRLNHWEDIGNFRFSTPVLNAGIGSYPGSYANGIGRWCEEAHINVIGMENRQHSDPSAFNDMDYNDILFKVVSDPIIKPIDEVPVNPEEDSENITGTLAFEDNWPKKGDYDFNDFVTSYVYSLIRDKGAKAVKSIRMTFIPRALGATYNNGFAIQLPVNAGDIKEVTGGKLENDNGKAVIVVYDDTRRDCFEGKGGYINTLPDNHYISGRSQTVNIILNTPSSLHSFGEFNPFIYVGNREHEIHLTDMPPTDKMDMTLLGQEDDKSDSSKGSYYRTNNTHPWALDIPSAINSTGNVWEYPIEGVIISNAYPNYYNWIANHSINWLLPQNPEYIYK